MRALIAVFIMVVLTLPASAQGKSEYCNTLADVFAQALEMRDAGVTLADAITALTEAHADAHPTTVRALKNDVAIAYDSKSKPGNAARAMYFEICMTS